MKKLIASLLLNFYSVIFVYITAILKDMFTIQANPSGTRSIKVSEEHLKTIQEYGLFNHLVDSNGLVTEDVLNKLKLNIRSLIAHQKEDSKPLLDLCIDVIYHKKMKAFGLQELMKLYNQNIQVVSETAKDVEEATEE